MERFYDPRQEKKDQITDPRVGRRGLLQYDAAIDSGSSGGEVTDLHPERAYDTDIRRLNKENRIVSHTADTSNDHQQKRVAKFMEAARTAGKFQQKRMIDEPQIRGKTPRGEANIKGTALPSLGDTIGQAGSTNYANKPQQTAGIFRGF